MLASGHAERMEFSGVHVPLVTPFDAGGAVALDALARLAHEVLDDGATGLVALGTTAEPGALTDAERAAVVDVVARVCRERRAPLIAGGGHAPDGTTAALALVPPFTRPGADGVLAHLRAVAAASPVPLVVYHVPQRTGQELAAAELRRVAEIPGVAAMKYAAGRVDADTAAFLTDLPDGFAVLAGDDALLAPLLSLGAVGGVAASAHVATSAFARLVRSWPDTGLVRPLARLAVALFAEPNPAVVKAVLHAQGRIPTPAVRLPLLPASAASRDAALALVS